jgi:hypothetical protein
MIDARPADDLLKLLSRWSGNQPLRNSDRVRLVCHQPQRGSYAYLHRLYAGLSDAEIAEIEAMVGHSIPRRLYEFYTATNGARLFEGQISVSGLVRDFSRDPAREIPISIDQDNLTFAALRSEWHRQGYVRIGSVSFLRQDEIICGPDDRIVVLHAETGEPLRQYPNVFHCLESFTREMAQFWEADGTFTGDWAVIDHLLLGVGGTA